MKHHELPCYLVEDLLPLYADHLVAPQTEADIQAHLSHCKSCTLKYQSMTAPLEPPKQADDAGGIQFLKKERRMERRKIFAAVICCLVLFLGVFYWIAFRQQAFHFQVENLYQLADGSIYFELVPSDKEDAINGISYHEQISQNPSRCEIQMGYSLLSLWQSQTGTSNGRIYCFVRTPEPNADGTGYLPVYYTQGSSQLLIWDGEEKLPDAPDTVEQYAASTLSPFSIRNGF